MKRRIGRFDSSLPTGKGSPIRHAPDGPLTVAFVSLGCPKNLVDSEKMLGLLAGRGIIPTPDPADADVIIINTCGFIEASKQESLEAIAGAAQFKRTGRASRVVVAGCLATRMGREIIRSVPGVDAVVGVGQREQIVDAVLGQAGPSLFLGRGDRHVEADTARLRLTPRHYAYLRISEGCSRGCSFCTIPSIRGPFRSKPADLVVAEARELIADGAVELNLIGQDTTRYGADLPASTALAPQRNLGGSFRPAGGEKPGGGGSEEKRNTPYRFVSLPELPQNPIESKTAGFDWILPPPPGFSPSPSCAVVPKGSRENGGPLAALLRRLDRLAGVQWLRLLYAYPNGFGDDLIDALAGCEHVVPYVDLPIQHINDRILARMRRRVTRAEIESLLVKLRDRVPHLAIRTTLITGFPGETVAEHRELLAFIQDFRFDMLGVFSYSQEASTPAGRMADQVPEPVKHARRAELMEAQQRIVLRRNADLIGAKTMALVDRWSAPGLLAARTPGQAPEVDSVTLLPARGPAAAAGQARGRPASLRPGQLVPIRITGYRGYDLLAEKRENEK